MTHRRKPSVPQHRVIFVGCEGASEACYVRRLQDMIRDAKIKVKLEIRDLGLGAGDPLSRVKKAAAILKDYKRKRVVPDACFILLDSDQAADLPDTPTMLSARQDCGNHKLTLIWQQPCFEAVLLRHLEGRDQHRPLTSNQAKQSLIKVWPEYQKPMSATLLESRIDVLALERAAQVEPELRAFLICIGLIGGETG